MLIAGQWVDDGPGPGADALFSGWCGASTTVAGGGAARTVCAQLRIVIDPMLITGQRLDDGGRYRHAG